jgi:hypothetical protein
LIFDNDEVKAFVEEAAAIRRRAEDVNFMIVVFYVLASMVGIGF